MVVIQQPNPTVFGTMIRAARLGYHRHPSLNAFIRISDLGTMFLVEIVANPIDMKSQKIKHVCWWEHGEYDKLIEFSSFFSDLHQKCYEGPLDLPIKICLDEYGDKINQ